MKSHSSRYRSVRATVAAIVGAAAIGAYIQPTLAADESGELEEVTVTGSRILRPDLTSNSPLVTVDSRALEERSGLNIESYLNQLPNFNPAASPTTTQGDVQISAVNSVGISAVSLRGFGANRSLVLLNGRRAVPNNALMVVDINGIPSSMIKRAEIISGGASAVYGADAIGGVSNFLLRDDFEGLEVDAQWGTTAAGDGDQTRASVIAGSAVGDGRGHIVFATEYYDRKAMFNKNRDFYRNAWKDPSVPGNFLGFVFGENGVNNLFNPANATTMATILGKQPNQVYPFPGSGVFAGYRFNPDGTVFNPSGDNRASFKLPLDDFRYSLVNVYDNTQNPANPVLIQQVKYNETEGYTSSPQTRFSFMASANYDITDSIRFASSARFAQSTTKTFLAGTNASYGWEASIPFNPAIDSPVDPTIDYRIAANVTAALNGGLRNPGYRATGTTGASHPVPLQQALLLLSRGAPGSAQQVAPWILETYPLNSFGRRATENVNDVWQIEAGLTFDLPVKDWTAEVYYSRGESNTYNVATGNNSLARWRGMVTAPDYGRNANLQSNLTNNGPGANPGFGSVPVHCTSGFYGTIFLGDQPPTEDCIYAVAAALQTRTENQQDIVELNFQGGIMDLPAGELRAAFGYQGRRNAAQFNPDILQSTAEFNDQVIGVYPTGYLDKQIKVKDYYAELLIPVIGGFSWLKKFELDVGGRYSDYDVTDSTKTYKINGNIEINDYLRLRGGYNRSTRAPNLGELYLNLQQVFGAGGVYGDPCGPLSNSPFGAGGVLGVNPYPTVVGNAAIASGQTQAGANSTYLICQAQMGSTAASYFYSAANTTPPGATGGGFAWNNQRGNPDLTSEKADTWTAGFVLQSPFEGAWTRGITITADWYNIKINDTIEPYSVDYARYLCYGTTQVSTPAEAAARAASPECQAVPRSPSTGGALTQLLAYSNQATISTAGVDFAVNWVFNLGDVGFESVPGSLGLNVQGTWLDYYKTKQSPASYDPVIDWKGSLGPQLTGFNGGAYDYRLNTSLAYILPSFSVNLRWRHLPKVDVFNKAQENAIIENNARVTAGGGGTLLSYTPITNVEVASYDVFDLSANWNLNDTFSLRAGVDNVFDRSPASTGRTNGRPAGTNLSAVCGGAPGCQNPTSYSYPNSGAGTTSAGYYDTIGRSYFVGVKARF